MWLVLAVRAGQSYDPGIGCSQDSVQLHFIFSGVVIKVPLCDNVLYSHSLLWL